MAEGNQNLNPVQGDNSSEVTEGEYGLLSGSPTTEYNDVTFGVIDYLFCSIKSEMMKGLDVFLLKNIKEVLSVDINPRQTRKYCRYPVPKKAHPKTQMIAMLVHAMKSQMMEEIDDFVLKEIGKLLSEGLPEDDTDSLPTEEVNMKENACDVKDDAMDGTEDNVLFDGDFLEINDLKSPLSDEKPN